MEVLPRPAPLRTDDAQGRSCVVGGGRLRKRGVAARPGNGHTGPTYQPRSPIGFSANLAPVPDPSRNATPNAPLRSALPWFAAVVVVLAAAVTGGLLLAYVVAGGRTDDDGGVGAASSTPRRTAVVTVAPTRTGPATVAPQSDQPRRTPTPEPVVTPGATPFLHTVGRGESLTYIAGLYCVTVEELIELNEIANPNRIQVGQELQIPGTGCRP